MSDPNQPPPPGGGFPPPPGGQPPYQPPSQPPPPGGGGYGGPPGGFSPPPAQPYGGGGMPQLDVGAALSYGWKKFTENVGPFVVLMIAVAVAGIVIQFVQRVLTPNGGFAGLFWGLALSVAAFVAMQIVQAGVWRAGLVVTRGHKPEVALLTETSNIGAYIILSILIGLGLIVGLMLCILPGIAWLIFTAYAPLLVLDRGMEPVEAISTSFRWVKDNFGQVFVILLVCFILYVAGGLLCGVGLLVTAPVALVAITYSYRALTNEPVAP
jgi:uncharacterized membrane protein